MRMTVVLEGAQSTVACVTAGTATELVIPAARVQAAASAPSALAGCPSCVTLTVEARSQVEVTAGAHAIALRHESMRSVALVVKR